MPVSHRGPLPCALLRCLPLLLCALLGAAEGPRQPALAAIAARGRLVVAQYGGERFPFFFRGADGALIGHDVELARAMAAALGVELELLRSARTFEETVDQVRRGDADLALSKLSVSLDRARRVRFSQPYLVQSEALLVNRRHAARAAEDDPWAGCAAPEARIGVVRGTSFEGAAAALFPRARLERFDQPTGLVGAVVRGAVQAAYHDEIVFTEILRLRPQVSLWADLRLIPGRQDRLAVALPGDDGQFAAWVDLFLDGRGPRQGVEALLARWLPREAAAHPPGVAERAAALDAALQDAMASAAPAAPVRPWGRIALLLVALALVVAAMATAFAAAARRSA